MLVIEQTARDQGADNEDDDAPQLLRESLVDDVRNLGRAVFRDSLAPQFLLVKLLLSGNDIFELEDVGRAS